jgi:glycosyltransferase 2 family protein
VYKRLAINLLKYSLALGVLTYVVCANWEPTDGHGLKYVWDNHVLTGGAGVHWDYLLYGFALFELGVLLTLVRWYMLVRCQGLPLTLGNAIRLGMIGCFFNAFLPGSVGGDIVKAAALAREQSRRTVAVATVVMDRVIALWGLFWLVGILGAWFWLTGQLETDGGPQSKLVIEVTAVLLAVSLVVWFAMGFLNNERAESFALRLARLPKVGGSAAEFWRAVWLYRCQPRTVLLTIVLSWIGFALFVPAYYFCAYTLWSSEMGKMPTLQQQFLLVPIGLIMRAVPGFPGGVGIGEGSFGVLFVWFTGDNKSAAIGIVGSLVQRFALEWGTGLIGYVVYRALPPAVAADRSPAVTAPAPQPAVEVEDAVTQVWLPAQAESR